MWASQRTYTSPAAGASDVGHKHPHDSRRHHMHVGLIAFARAGREACRYSAESTLACPRKQRAQLGQATGGETQGLQPSTTSSPDFISGELQACLYIIIIYMQLLLKSNHANP